MPKFAFFQRWRIGDARRALKKLWDDPDDTSAVFEIIAALPGRAVERGYARFRKTELGARILAERRDLLSVLQDQAYLRSLPTESLGRVYHEFMTVDQLTADGLVVASEAGGREKTEDPSLALFGARLRDMHDLWHIATGYHRDLRGEIALLAFSFAQVRTPGVGFIVAMAYKGADAEEQRLIRSGWRRGRNAEWLPAVDWEAMLPRPLDDVREALRLGKPPVYERVFSDGAPAAQAV